MPEHLGSALARPDFLHPRHTARTGMAWMLGSRFACPSMTKPRLVPARLDFSAAKSCHPAHRPGAAVV